MKTAAEFVFCPYCRTRLRMRRMFNQNLAACPECGFVRFKDPKVAVIARITRSGKILLVQRRYRPEKGKWALPGGFMDADEMPEAALHRELDEELGIRVRINQLIGIFPSRGGDGLQNGIVLAFDASLPTDAASDALQSNDDISDAGWFSPDNLPVLAFETTRALVENRPAA